MIVSSGSGYVALLLHAHLPYVRQEHEELTLEERWFYEAVTDTYIPLLDLLDRLFADGVDFRLTLSLSPTLLAMMEDPVMQRRTRRHIASLRELAQKEVLRLWGDANYIATAIHYAERYKALEALYDRWGGDLIARLRRLQELGCVELIPCAATHAFLPLVKNAEALRAQLEAAVTEFRRHFGRTPAGIWLPECGYTPAVEPHLQALGLRYFVVDAHTVGHAATAGAKALCGAPVRTAGGGAAFARDPEASTQVWNAESGYPSDPEYREYYRDIGFDLGRGNEAEWRYIKPYVLPDGERIHTGLKYHRVSGRTDAKEPYRPELAALKAQQHAEHFLAARAEQLQRLATEASQPAVIVCPYDAELFGHWWYEGILWLETVLRGLGSFKPSTPTASALQSTTLSEYLALYPPTAEAKLPESSWGRGGYAEVWLQPATDWIYPRLHEAEHRMIRIARRHPDPSALSHMQLRLLNQAAKVLLLAQASDWAFILDAKTVTEYAKHRVQEHLHQFHQLVDFVDGSSNLLQRESTFQFLEQAERRTPIFPSVSYTIYQPLASNQAVNYPMPLKPELQQDQQLNILMLAWEYPPRIIGGLSRAVCDLSRHLAASGHQVHVMTCAVPGLPVYEMMEGVHVHRITILQSLTPVAFIDWVFQMNLAFTDYIIALADQGMAFDLIHAHDWLVYYSAAQSKQALRIPLIATIHATESGRNQGVLHSDLQLRIHALEHKLTAAADRIITCSRSMTNEVGSLFNLPSNKILTIPNGVDFMRYPTIHQLLPTSSLQEALQQTNHDRILCFMGRLVQEKGIHILIEAMSLVLHTHPSAKLLIAGVGPTMNQLIEQAASASLSDRIQFVGFLNETDKNILLHHAELCIFPSLYEPFGIVALEAMSRFTPVIVSDVGGLGEIIEHGVDGCKVTPGDANILAEQITALLNEPEYGKQLAATAANKVKLNYNWPSIGADTVKAYYELTSKSS